MQQKHEVREYTTGEEIFNSVTHGIGVVLAIAAIPILVVKSVKDGGGVLLAASLIYAISLLIEYTMSTLYHAFTNETAKKVFKILDHSCIYILICGTYTPYCLISLAPYGGIWLFIAVWAISIAGIACEAFWVFRPRWISAVLYLILGWLIIWFCPTLAGILDTAGFWLLVSGGIAYSVGCIFYVLKKIPYMHSIFHLFVLAGSILHFFSILLFVV